MKYQICISLLLLTLATKLEARKKPTLYEFTGTVEVTPVYSHDWNGSFTDAEGNRTDVYCDEDSISGTHCGELGADPIRITLDASDPEEEHEVGILFPDYHVGSPPAECNQLIRGLDHIWDCDPLRKLKYQHAGTFHYRRLWVFGEGWTKGYHTKHPKGLGWVDICVPYEFTTRTGKTYQSEACYQTGF